MNLTERIDTLKALDLIMRGLNDEELFNSWITYGIEDECKDYAYYATDETFAEMLTLFCSLMKTATKEAGALYFDGIISK